MNPSNVDPVKCPRLYAALQRMKDAAREGWLKVSELRKAGDTDAASRLSRKLLGVKNPPMTEEKKAELKAYNETHKDEIKERRHHEREVRRRTMALLRPRHKTDRK